MFDDGPVEPYTLPGCRRFFRVLCILGFLYATCGVWDFSMRESAEREARIHEHETRTVQEALAWTQTAQAQPTPTATWDGLFPTSLPTPTPSPTATLMWAAAATFVR